MAKTRAQKEQTVQNLKENLSRAKALVFADYQGLTMKQLSELRQKLAEANAEFTITKNSLLSRAVPTAYRLPPTTYQNPTAVLFAYDDQITPIKLLVKTLKDAGLGKFKAGFLGKDFLDEDKLLQISTLPTKDELYGQTVGVLAAPLQGMVGVLQANLRNLVYALDQLRFNRSQIKLSKGGV